jgi:hypothetical protein
MAIKDRDSLVPPLINLLLQGLYSEASLSKRFSTLNEFHVVQRYKGVSLVYLIKLLGACLGALLHLLD